MSEGKDYEINEAVQNRWQELMQRPGFQIGDFSPWYLYFLEDFLKLSNVKILVLQRNKEDTCQSFQKWFSQWNFFPWISDENRSKLNIKFQDKNDEINGDSIQDEEFSDNQFWYDCYPHYSEVTYRRYLEYKYNQKSELDLKQIDIKDGASIFYDDYYFKVGRFMEKLGANSQQFIKLVDSYDLLYGLGRLSNFLKIFIFCKFGIFT